LTREEARKFKFSGEWLILRTLKTYTRTASGRCWKSHPDSITREVITPREYENYITAVPFFAGWGDGASCRTREGYTQAGRVPVEVFTTGPWNCARKVATFEIFSLSDLREHAGARERAVLDEAETFEPFKVVPGHGLAWTLVTRDGRRATFDEAFLRWIY